VKVTRVEAIPEVAGPRPNPIRDALQLLDGGGSVRVRLETDDGVVGYSATHFGRLRAAPGVLARLIEDELAPEVLGEDPFMVRHIREKLWRLTDYHGTAGLALLGISALDVALWDVMGKAVGKPVWRLLGAQRDRVPTYAMVGWLNYDLDELKAICAKAVSQGFRGVKMKVGCPTLEEDVRRIEAVRSVLGPDDLLMVDANQVFGLTEALRRGRAYQELGCYWFEEPLRADDFDGLAELSRQLDIPIATGENNYGKRQFRDLLARRGADIVQPDLRRAGGITECFEIGLMADAFGVPYASHGGGPHLHVLAALPNTLMMESGLLPADGRVQLVDGCYPLPEEPGFGSTATGF
jgi:L-alanine-DL-glutamate epimerase-like enolase superfamily enzyme